MIVNKKNIVENILDRLEKPMDSYDTGNFKYWVIDDLLPTQIAINISESFPDENVLRKRKSLREYKRVGVDFEFYDKLMEDITYSFHDPKVVNKICSVTGFKDMIPDHKLYAGGLSSMINGSFLNPHLDNSHNDDGSLYRVLNLLYYVSYNWKKPYGGNLVLYPNGIDKNSVTITSKFNRLVLMETNNYSIHGVTKVLNNSPRRCISNYYFSNNSTNGTDYKHVTSFFSFKKESLLKKIILSIDRTLRGRFSSVIKSTINYENWHKRN